MNLPVQTFYWILFDCSGSASLLWSSHNIDLSYPLSLYIIWQNIFCSSSRVWDTYFEEPLKQCFEMSSAALQKHLPISDIFSWNFCLTMARCRPFSSKCLQSLLSSIFLSSTNFSFPSEQNLFEPLDSCFLSSSSKWGQFSGILTTNAFHPYRSVKLAHLSTNLLYSALCHASYLKNLWGWVNIDEDIQMFSI